MCLMELDGFGFESRVPDPARVQTAYVYNVTTYPEDDARWAQFTADDPETIALVTQLHRQIVSEKAGWRSIETCTSPTTPPTRRGGRADRGLEGRPAVLRHDRRGP